MWLITVFVRALLIAMEAVFWIMSLTWGLFVKVADATGAAAAVKDGVLRCPRGHAIPLSAGTYECAACKFTYEGSILKCGNPECGASTPYINCPECGLSVRNPYRWGRP